MERRINRRFKVKEGGFALLQSEPFIVGEINDISRGGLSFFYFERKNQNTDASGINIIFSRDSFLLAIDQFKPIADLPISQDTDNLSSLKMRRHNIQFGKLDKSEIEELEYFIDNYTRN